MYYKTHLAPALVDVYIIDYSKPRKIGVRGMGKLALAYSRRHSSQRVSPCRRHIAQPAYTLTVNSHLKTRHIEIHKQIIVIVDIICPHTPHRGHSRYAELIRHPREAESPGRLFTTSSLPESPIGPPVLCWLSVKSTETTEVALTTSGILTDMSTGEIPFHVPTNRALSEHEAISSAAPETSAPASIDSIFDIIVLIYRYF